MRLFVLGATGHVGTQVLELALAKGHTVTAFVRSPQKLTPQAGLQIVAGDGRDADALGAALAGHDAVLSSIGGSPRETLRASSLMTECGASLVRAMSLGEVGRLVIVSAAVLFPLRGFRFAFFRWLLRHHAYDLRRMEDIVRGSSLAWTIARPPRLVHAPEESCRRVADALPAHGRVASFRAVAAFMLEAVEADAHVRQIVGLAR
jgi:putative NADH-flavin reductase